MHPVTESTPMVGRPRMPWCSMQCRAYSVDLNPFIPTTVEMITKDLLCYYKYNTLWADPQDEITLTPK